jgi:hypothetical protein
MLRFCWSGDQQRREKISADYKQNLRLDIYHEGCAILHKGYAILHEGYVILHEGNVILHEGYAG